MAAQLTGWGTGRVAGRVKKGLTCNDNSGNSSAIQGKTLIIDA